jgi:hypothetical protein
MKTKRKKKTKLHQTMTFGTLLVALALAVQLALCSNANVKRVTLYNNGESHGGVPATVGESDFAKGSKGELNFPNINLNFNHKGLRYWFDSLNRLKACKKRYQADGSAPIGSVVTHRGRNVTTVRRRKKQNKKKKKICF